MCCVCYCLSYATVSSDEGFESTSRKRMFAYDDDDVESSSSPPGDGAMR